ncbi:DDE 3 domain containing protein [Trichonephila clavipes]|nr:DDE 3 domain containing protein [Trichonephila clavipes]
MITNFFIPQLNNHDVQELWFQQDGATCHTARATIDLLKDTFGDRLISRFGPVNWPPRSCDLTPLDYFLWGYVRSSVYADKPQTLDHLEDNIRRVIADIRPQMLEKVIENWTSRLDYIRASRGSPMPEILFKIRQAATPLLRLVEVPEPIQGFFLKVRVEPSQNVLSSEWCSKLRVTTGVQLALCRDEYHGPQSDCVRQYKPKLVLSPAWCSKLRITTGVQ